MSSGETNWELYPFQHAAIVNIDKVETRSGLIPRSFNAIPGFSQFAYSTVANAWLKSGGSDTFLDSLEHDLTETVMSSDVDDRFSPPAITNAALALLADRNQVLGHFMKVAPHGPNVESMLPVKVTNLRAVWEVEYV